MSQLDITIGPFTAGEKPLAIPVSFLEKPEDLTGWDLAVTAEIDGVEQLAYGATITWEDATLAQALLVLPALTAAGTGHAVQVWTGDSAQRIASLPIRFTVVAAIGTAPSI